jgi:hypothetical protein
MERKDILCEGIKSFNEKVPQLLKEDKGTYNTQDCVTREEFGEVLRHAHGEFSRLALVYRDTYDQETIRNAREWRWPAEWGDVGCGGSILSSILDLRLDTLLQEIRKIERRMSLLEMHMQ